MPKLNGFEFLEAISKSEYKGDLKQISGTIGFDLYINKQAELFIYDRKTRKLIQFKTRKDITKDSTFFSLFETYELIFK